MPALALFLIGGAKSIFGTVAGWLSRRSLIELLFMALAVFALVQHFQLVTARSDAGRWHKQFDAEHKARAADRASYEAAQRQAAANNQAHITQIEKQQDAVNEKARSDYRRDLDRLRAQSRTAQGSPGGSKATGVPKTPGGAHADGLPAAPCDNLCASEIELRLMYLQNWVADQMKVER